MPDPVTTSSTPDATKAAAQTREVSRIQPAPESPPKECRGKDSRYKTGPGVTRASSVSIYERKTDDPVYRPLSVYTLDQATVSVDGATAVLNVPYEPLQPGPKGSLFE